MKSTRTSSTLFLLATAVALLALSGCKSKAEKAYANCMSQMEKAANEAVGSEKASSEAEKAFAQTAATMVQAMGASVCGQVKEACDKDENGAVCQAAIGQYK
jgi:hypothetical protein